MSYAITNLNNVKIDFTVTITQNASAQAGLNLYKNGIQSILYAIVMGSDSNTNIKVYHSDNEGSLIGTYTFSYSIPLNEAVTYSLEWCKDSLVLKTGDVELFSLSGVDEFNLFTVESSLNSTNELVGQQKLDCIKEENPPTQTSNSDVWIALFAVFLTLTILFVISTTVLGIKYFNKK